MAVCPLGGASVNKGCVQRSGSATLGCCGQRGGRHGEALGWGLAGRVNGPGQLRVPVPAAPSALSWSISLRAGRAFSAGGFPRSRVTCRERAAPLPPLASFPAALGRAGAHAQRGLRSRFRFRPDVPSPSGPQSPSGPGPAGAAPRRGEGPGGGGKAAAEGSGAGGPRPGGSEGTRGPAVTRGGGARRGPSAWPGAGRERCVCELKSGAAGGAEPSGPRQRTPRESVNSER